MKALRLDARLAKLDERIPKPQPAEKPAPVHPEHAARVIALTTTMFPSLLEHPELRGTDELELAQAECVRFWSEPEEYPKGVFRKPLTDRQTAERLADLAWELMPEVAEVPKPYPEFRDWYLATHKGDCPRDEKSVRNRWLLFEGERGLQRALADAMVARIEGRQVPDARLDELAQIAMKLEKPVSMDGYVHPCELFGKPPPDWVMPPSERNG